VGADRIVNAVAAFEKYRTAVVVVDFGTATTFDCVSERGEYLGGVIAPGIGISVEALFQRASKLPRVELVRPKNVIGKNTVNSMQSGILFGYTGLVDGIVERIRKEYKSPPRVIATGGLAHLIAAESATIERVDRTSRWTAPDLHERNREPGARRSHGPARHRFEPRQHHEEKHGHRVQFGGAARARREAVRVEALQGRNLKRAIRWTPFDAVPRTWGSRTGGEGLRREELCQLICKEFYHPTYYLNLGGCTWPGHEAAYNFFRKGSRWIVDPACAPRGSFGERSPPVGFLARTWSTGPSARSATRSPPRCGAARRTSRERGPWRPAEEAMTKSGMRARHGHPAPLGPHAGRRLRACARADMPRRSHDEGNPHEGSEEPRAHRTRRLREDEPR
jgi:hypothetical protein